MQPLNPAICALLISAAFLMPAIPAVANPDHPLNPAGVWYLALDAEPYGLPTGAVLPGLVMINRERTALFTDGGDFGGFPFPTRDSNQFASWRWTRDGIHMVSLFLQADTISGDVVAWNRVELSLSWENRDTLTGTVNVFRLPCLGPAPVGAFNCLDPIAHATEFVQDPVSNVDVTLKRLRVRF